ncbi:hypothetical protein AC579_10174 [Pseudocercospora musae]|uniref:Lysine-specific metallo-endopeptidase domain-containing protein n=1 Tax=Pseudocercospora musae TaxID=113226 RepID=A0A139HZ90_9PEZI|nr:hypothetical protein AC579_10174 [Pseudocercospora musae]
MRFASLIAAAFVALLPFALARRKDYYPDGGPSMATLEEAELMYESFGKGVAGRTIGCLPKRGPYITDAMANAVAMLDLTSKLRGGKRFVPSSDGRIIDLEGSSRPTAEELLRSEERYFGKLSEEKQDTVTATLANALTKLSKVHMMCLEACPRTVAALETRLHNETIHFCPLLFDDGQSWWDIVRIESAHTCRTLTIIHEMMHLADRPFPGMNIGVFPEHTGDQVIPRCKAGESNCKAYGRGAAQTLARHSARLAFQNADNYAFYVADVVLAYTDGMKELERRRQQEVEPSWPSTIEPTTQPDELPNEITSSDTAEPRPDLTKSQEDESQSVTDSTATHLPDDNETSTDVSQPQSVDREPTKTLQDDRQTGVDARVEHGLNGMLKRFFGLSGKSKNVDGVRTSQDAVHASSGGAQRTSLPGQGDRDEL